MGLLVNKRLKKNPTRSARKRKQGYLLSKPFTTSGEDAVHSTLAGLPGQTSDSTKQRLHLDQQLLFVPRSVDRLRLASFVPFSLVNFSLTRRKPSGWRQHRSRRRRVKRASVLVATEGKLLLSRLRGRDLLGGRRKIAVLQAKRTEKY
jgi:hypothetical protein